MRCDRTGQLAGRICDYYEFVALLVVARAAAPHQAPLDTSHSEATSAPGALMTLCVVRADQPHCKHET